MNAELAILIGVLFSVGTYLLMQRTITRIILGFGVLGNGVNLLIVSTSSQPGNAPVSGTATPKSMTDPIPQAFVLTGIVIGLAVTAFLLALAWRNWTLDGNDEVEDDISDRLIARRGAQGSRESSTEDGDF